MLIMKHVLSYTQYTAMAAARTSRARRRHSGVFCGWGGNEMKRGWGEWEGTQDHPEWQDQAKQTKQPTN
jgi:hypothetical protein